jgi:DNA-binding PadR family transcriptional regulator
MSISTAKSHYGNLSPEFAVLGLLCGGPLHGYDLHKILVTDLGQVWHISQSQCYAILKRLESRGDISSEPIPQEKLPAKQMLQITAAGRQRFAAWMGAPVGGSIRAVRMEFLTRLYFTNIYEPEKTEQLFQAQSGEIEKQIQRLASAQQELPVEQVFNRMSLEMRIRQLRLALDWLEDCRKSFGSNTPPSHHSYKGATK